MKHFEVTMAVSVKITIYWNVMQCSFGKEFTDVSNQVTASY